MGTFKFLRIYSKLISLVKLKNNFYFFISKLWIDVSILLPLLIFFYHNNLIYVNVLRSLCKNRKYAALEGILKWIRIFLCLLLRQKRDFNSLRNFKTQLCNSDNRLVFECDNSIISTSKITKLPSVLMVNKEK